jgi:AcrR family transcriptional regulator
MNSLADRPDKQRRRGEILDAAFLEFSTKGYAGASMEAIARRAHASKQTLYAWFENKEALLNTLFAARLDAMKSRTVQAAENDPSPANVLPAVAEDTLRFALAMAPLIGAIGPGEQGASAFRTLGRTIGKEREKFVEYLMWRRAEGDIAFDDDPVEIASLFVAMALGEWSMRLGTGMLETLTDRMIEDHARRAARIFLKGLAPKSGRSATPAVPSAANGRTVRAD